MSTNEINPKGQTGDASDVVEGPVGNAKLVDPSVSGPSNVNLDALDSIEVQGDDSTDEKRLTPTLAGSHLGQS